VRGRSIPLFRRGVAAKRWPPLLLVLSCACATGTPEPSSLSLEEKIGQLFVLAERAVFRNERSPEDEELLRRVRDQHVGGVLWYLSSDVAEASRLSRRLQAAARTPLLISADLEAGTGMRFESTTTWPWPMAVAATGDPELAERQGRAVGEEARALGINQINAPVADVNLDPENPVINVRSYGEDPQQVARFVAAFVRGVQSAHVIATLKHFPGHGDSRTDSHRSLPVLAASRERLEQVELVPFRAGIAAGARAVMTAHVAVPSLDATPAPVRPEGPSENPFARSPEEVTRGGTTPASLSPAVTDGLLRGELGFEGLVVTDATDMGALVDHYGPGESAVRAILAGADQILKSPDPDAAMAAVRRAVETGEISRERLDRSVARILSAKRWAGAPHPDPEEAFRIVDSPAHRALAEEIARRSVTLLREAPGVLPLSPRARIAQITVTDGAERIGNDLARELKRRLSSEPSGFALDARSTEAELEPALEAAASSDAVLLCLFIRTQGGKGTIALPPALRPALGRLLDLGARIIVIAFGSPYVLGDLPRAQTAVAAYGGETDAQVAVARALFGEAAITGRLPVTIPGFAARDTGIRKPAKETR
jgi:beta-N-acetylhexosaminidase